MFNKEKSRFRLKIEEAVQNHLEDKSWIFHGFSRFLFSKYNIYPSVSYEFIAKAIEKRGYKIEEQPMKFFYLDESSERFKQNLEKISNQIGDQNIHSSMYEFIIGLAIFKIQNEFPKNFPSPMVFELEKQFENYRADIFVEYSATCKMCIEVKNIAGHLGLGYKNTEEKIDNYIKKSLVPFFIAPFLGRNLQKKLEEVNGFYCNLGYNITQYVDNDIIDAFYEEGFGDTFIFYKLEKWKTAGEAKAWLKEKIKDGKFEEISKIGEEIFSDKRMNFILRKIRGIMRFANLKIVKLELIRNYKILSKLTRIKMTKTSLEKITLLDELYFQFLTRPNRQFSIDELIGYMLKKSNFLKNQTRKKEEPLLRKWLRLLKNLNLLNEKMESTLQKM